MITSFTNVAVGDRIFTVHEMTVAEVRQWLLDVENGTAVVDPVGEFVVTGCSVADLARMCHVQAAEFDAFRPSEIQPVVEAAKKLNPHFSRCGRSCSRRRSPSQGSFCRPKSRTKLRDSLRDGAFERLVLSVAYLPRGHEGEQSWWIRP